MQLKGENRCAASAADVYAALLDPARLAAALPGCKSLTETEPGTYTGQAALGVGPVVGTYSVTMQVTEQQPNHYLRLAAQARGTTGQVAFTMELHLQETEGTTQVAWVVDAHVSGLVASVGSRVLGGVARRTADQFFAALLAS